MYRTKRTAPPAEEFPNISESDIKKFNSFDSELGWERQANQVRKIDNGDHKPDDSDADRVTFSTDKYSSRVCSKDRDNSEFTVTSYGDSHCACRGVEDEETFQHYLSQDLDIHVGNYGVGNYGLDQALLRMKRRFNQDPSKYVIFASSDIVTINRLLSVWKHYFEFGNTFAVKPRYKLNEGDLELIPTPIDQRSDLLYLQRHAEYLRKHDYHYENYFLPRKLKRPYLRYWLQSPFEIPCATLEVIEYTVDNYSPIKAPQLYKKCPSQNIDKSKYRKKLEEEHLDILCAVLSEFSDFVRSQGSVPIFLPITHGDPRKRDEWIPIGTTVKKQIAQQCPELYIVDYREKIANELGGYSEYYKPRRNQYIAEHLAEFIQNHQSSE